MRSFNVLLLLLLAPAAAAAQEISLPANALVAPSMSAIGADASIRSSLVVGPFAPPAGTGGAVVPGSGALGPVAPRFTQSNPPRRSAAVPVIVGAVAGAAIGTALLFAPGDCRTAESMCGIAIPLYAGGGALAGGLIGYLLARR